MWHLLWHLHAANTRIGDDTDNGFMSVEKLLRRKTYVSNCEKKELVSFTTKTNKHNNWCLIPRSSALLICFFLFDQNSPCVSDPFGSSTFYIYRPAYRKCVLLWRHHRDTNHLRPVCNRKAKRIEAFCPKSAGLLFWSCIHIHCLYACLPEAGHSGDRNDLVEELPIAQGRTYVIVVPLFICPLHTRDQYLAVVIFRLIMEPLMDYKTIITGI